MSAVDQEVHTSRAHPSFCKYQVTESIFTLPGWDNKSLPPPPRHIINMAVPICISKWREAL